MLRRTSTRIGLLVAIVVATLSACAPAPDVTPEGSATGTPSGSVSSPARPATPAPGHEVFGYLPYWEMDAGIAAHLATTRLTTLALFSVTNTSRGAIDTSQNGYRRIVGPIGTQVIGEAHGRGVRVELVYSSFGRDRNRRFFEDPDLQDATIDALVTLAGKLGVDGVNADVEALDPDLVPAYGAFLARLRAAVVAADPADRLSVATQASLLGAAMAAAAAEAGADRIFLMGYDYRVAGSEPGATSPLDRRDGEVKDLVWSLDLYGALGVPPERTILGLPLYGLSWPVIDPELGAPATGRGEAWVPRRNLELLLDPAAVPLRDEVEAVELYVLDGKGVPYRRSPVVASPTPAGSATAPDPAASTPGASSAAAPTTASPPAPTAVPQAGPWEAIYVDSPATLTRKLALANERGLAGAGFWAIGYERGLPGYTDLIARFAAGEPME